MAEDGGGGIQMSRHVAAGVRVKVCIGRAACQTVNEVSDFVLGGDGVANGVERGVGFEVGSDVLSPGCRVRTLKSLLEDSDLRVHILHRNVSEVYFGL